MHIENTAMTKSALMVMDDGELVAQHLVQQGAFHAVSFMLSTECNEEVAAQMLASLRANESKIREETRRRGKSLVFAQDQTAFTYM